MQTQEKRKAVLALGAALAFLVAAVIEAVVAVTKHQSAYAAAGLGAAAVLWFVVYWMWSKRG